MPNERNNNAKIIINKMLIRPGKILSFSRLTYKKNVFPNFSGPKNDKNFSILSHGNSECK